MTTRMLIATAVAATCLGVSAANAEPEPPKPARRLVLQIHEVKCRDETNGKFVEKFGGDEISLSGITIDPNGRAARVPTLRIGKFERDGAVVRFPLARALATFDLGTGHPFPRMYQTMLILAEKDQGGGLATRVDAIVKEVNSTPREAAFSAAGVVALEVAKEVGKAALKEARKEIERKLKDDLFPPELEGLTMRDETFRFANGALSSPRRTLTVNAHQGKYQITFSWRLVQ